MSKLYLKNFKTEELFSIKLGSKHVIDLFGAGPQIQLVWNTQREAVEIMIIN
jgi:hypothetical protein